MRAARRLRDDAINQAKREQVLRRQPQGFCRRFRESRIAPENRGTAFGRDHRVDRILQHHHLIADADGERAARSAFARHGDDHRHAQPRHLAQVVSDGFGLAALFGVNARIGARRVDEREDRPLEFLCDFHYTQRLAITFGFGHAEVALLALLGGAALLMTDDDARLAVKARQAGDQRRVIAEAPVAMNFAEVRK